MIRRDSLLACRQVALFHLCQFLAAALLATAAFAQSSDQVGLYFDAAYTTHEYNTMSAPELVTAYLVLHYPSALVGVAGWECRLRIDGTATLVGTEYAGQAINVQTPPAYMVGVSNPPLPGGDTVLLARFQISIPDEERSLLSLVPTYFASLPGQLAYLNADGLDEILPMFPITIQDYAGRINVSTGPSCALNRDQLEFDVVPIESTTLRTLIVANQGAFALETTPTIIGGAGSFIVESEGQPFWIEPYSNETLDVYFTPDAVGDFAAQLQLSENCPLVDLQGTGREPILSWTMPTVIDFGEVYVGAAAYQSIVVRNTGDIGFLADPAVTDGCDGFQVISPSSYLSPGDTKVFSVWFTPTTVDSFECMLYMGDTLPPVTLRAVSRELTASWDAPTSIDFGDVDFGYTETRSLVITNTGDENIFIDYVLEPLCRVFTFNGPDFVTLVPGASSTSQLTFRPRELGEETWKLYLGPILPPVTLTGTSTREVFAYYVVPDRLQLPGTPLGVARFDQAMIFNQGNVPFEVAPQLDAGASVFTITSGTDSCPVGPGETGFVTVRFSPTEVMDYEATLSFGENLGQLPVLGTGLPADDICGTSPTVLDFGLLRSRNAMNGFITVSNSGTEPMVLTPTVDSPAFIVPTGPIEVPGGGQTLVKVTAYSGTVGVFAASVDLGPEACASVACTVTVTDSVLPLQDRVGLYFDEDCTQNYNDGISFQQFDLYLALLDCSSPNGIGAWECRMGYDGASALLLGATLEGQAVNVGTSPDFIVGLASPLMPSQTGTLLATMHWIPVSEGLVSFTLKPTTLPSIPGEMAWLVGGTDVIRPMHPATGLPTVAYWSGSSSGSIQVAVEAPRPIATTAGSQVTIRLDRPGDAFEACRFLRREGLEAPEPVSAMLPNSGAGLSFTDDLTGLEPGTTVYYSYSLYAAGREVARSPEVEVTVPAAATYATGLLANVPNPFNPQTEIRFQLEKAGPVRVVIYDVQGRCIRTLVDESLSSGTQSRMWLGLDDAGRQASSGAYYVRLETDGTIDTRKILLLK